MSLPRFRLRTMMIVVAAMAAVSGALAERRDRFLRLAEYHRSQFVGVDFVGVRNGWWGGPDPWPGSSGIWTDDRGKILTEEQSRKEDYHRALDVKYREAARCPWLPVPPDPPQRMP